MLSDFGRPVAFCAFPFLPKEENRRLPVACSPSWPHLESEEEVWGTETVPRVVAPRLSCGILLKVSVFLLLLLRSQPSTTLWAEEAACTLGGRGTLLLFPLGFLAGPLLMAILDLTADVTESVGLDSVSKPPLRSHVSSSRLSCLGSSRLQLWPGATDEVGLVFLGSEE